jgi:poly(ADP-ribose) glycohydrolase ARH3
MNLASKFQGAMVGSALGDAIGEMAFRRPDRNDLLAWIAQTGQLVYTDDTAMALGLAQSLVHIGHLDELHLGDTFRTNFRREPWRGYAVGPPTIFALVESQGTSYTEAASSLFEGQGSFGNGAAMRIAPLGLFFRDAPDLYEQAARSATVTHAHPIAQDGAALLAWAVARAVSLDPQAPFPLDSFCEGLVDLARTPEMQQKMETVLTLAVEDAPPGVAAHRLGKSVAMHQSLPFALYAFLSHPRSYQDCLFCAILNGGDSDTLGAMACAVSGAYLGIEAIPSPWQEKLENLETIENLALKLAQAHAWRTHS